MPFYPKRSSCYEKTSSSTLNHHGISSNRHCHGLAHRCANNNGLADHLRRRSLVKLRTTTSLLTWRHHHGRGSGRWYWLSSQDFARCSLNVAKHRKESLKGCERGTRCIFRSRKEHSGQKRKDMQGS
ncbi:unnamed protein product [Lasius platythorax]|uniref:Uncharacterized protein n=1 Tax=Lasius platythorax TaxID=488582 RepID=A0AAV2NDE4_9HYME